MSKIENPIDLYDQMTLAYLDYLEEKKDASSKYKKRYAKILEPLLQELKENIPRKLIKKVSQRICFDLRKVDGDHRILMADVIQTCLEKENFPTSRYSGDIKRVFKKKYIFPPSLFSQANLEDLSLAWSPYFEIDSLGYICLRINDDDENLISSEFRRET